MYTHLRNRVYLQTGGKIPKYLTASGALPDINDPSNPAYWLLKGINQLAAALMALEFSSGLIDASGNSKILNTAASTPDAGAIIANAMPLVKSLALEATEKLQKEKTSLFGTVKNMFGAMKNDVQEAIEDKEGLALSVGSMGGVAGGIADAVTSGMSGEGAKGIFSSLLEGGASGGGGLLNGITNNLALMNGVLGSNVGSMLGGVADLAKGFANGGFSGPSGGAMAGAANKLIDMADNALMGDKNFDEESLKTDQAINAISGTLAKVPGPWGPIASVALKAANFSAKANGQTVQGFDVDINSSGYDQAMGHLESQSTRDDLAFFGLAGLDTRRALKLMRERNEKALMALMASNIADTQAFDQQAATNSVLNTIERNQQALAGGYDTSLLAG